MNKRIFLSIIAILLLFSGCSKNISTTTTSGQKGQSTKEESNEENKSSQENEQSIIKTSDNKYDQYLKKVWVVKDGTNESPYNYPNLCISKIEDGKITARISDAGELAIPGNFYYSSEIFEELNGTIDGDIAELQFTRSNGSKGNIKLTFKGNDEIDANIKYTYKATDYESSIEGDFQFKPYNINDDKNAVINEDKSLSLDLECFGNVKFVPKKIKNDKDSLVEFYLTDNDGNIIYEFEPDLNTKPVEVNEDTFEDVNNDGLKDIIIIVNGRFTGKQTALIFFQQVNGKFNYEFKIDKAINDSNNNKDIKSVRDYLSKRF